MKTRKTFSHAGDLYAAVTGVPSSGGGVKCSLSF